VQAGKLLSLEFAEAFLTPKVKYRDSDKWITMYGYGLMFYLENPDACSVIKKMDQCWCERHHSSFSRMGYQCSTALKIWKAGIGSQFGRFMIWWLEKKQYETRNSSDSGGRRC
jgi:hypothetical protein